MRALFRCGLLLMQFGLPGLHLYILKVFMGRAAVLWHSICQGVDLSPGNDWD
jgi:hypothetical protein